MSRHLISAAQGRTTEIPNVLIYYEAEPLPKEEALSKSAGKDLVSLDSSRDFVK